MAFVRSVLWSYLLCMLVLATPARATGSFVNWEDPHVHPLELTPDGTRLLAVNTADNRLLVFELGGPEPRLTASIPVGLEPVSVRARSNTEAWVVNHISDSVSIVDLATRNVVATVPTDDEPADVAFAGSPRRAFITCSQANTVLVVDPSKPMAAPQRIPILGEDPRALAVSPDGRKVYAAIFESGNASTVLGGGNTLPGVFPPNAVEHPAGPYGGLNPPPNVGATFFPPMNPANPLPPKVPLIVKKDVQGRWMDDNLQDWTAFVSGPYAEDSGRVPGWDVADRDLAIIDTATLAVTYATGLMNINMALAVHPSGRVTVVGTDGLNQVRFEPVINGRFLRVELAWVEPATPSNKGIWDLNPHLTYATSTVPQAERNKSIGDPRGIAWNKAGSRGYVTGMGSNNVVVVDAVGQRVTQINVGEGPTGLAMDEKRARLYVLNRFDASLSVVSLLGNQEVERVPFFDPTPAVIRVGRKHLYDTHKTSGLGHVACASCHVDARMDRLAWDLGDPSGTVKSLAGQNLGMGIPGLPGGFQDWHPMKGPMTTQTLQDIIGKEPLHWRGDRAGLEEFNPAFVGLQGDDTMLSPAEMQQFKDFLATLTFPPNPFRNLDNSLPTNLPLPGHFTTGRFAPAGQQLPNGNAVNGLNMFRPPRLLDVGLACSTCHTLPTGLGTDSMWDGTRFAPLPKGPNGEHVHGLVTTDGSENVTLKVPQLRNLYEKVGTDMTHASSTTGIGFNHTGAVDSIARFVSFPVFGVASDQEVADMVAFLLAFSGSDLPRGSEDNVLEPPGPLSQDTHAAVGRQVTLSSALSTAEQRALLDTFLALADSGKVGLVVKGRQGGLARGYTYVGGGLFQSDRASQQVSAAQLRTMAGPGSALTWTVVPKGTELRIGIDRDEDGVFDRDALERGDCEDSQ